MNGRAWTATPLPVGLLLLALGVPCTAAARGSRGRQEGTRDLPRGEDPR